MSNTANKSDSNSCKTLFIMNNTEYLETQFGTTRVNQSTALDACEKCSAMLPVFDRYDALFNLRYARYSCYIEIRYEK